MDFKTIAKQIFQNAIGGLCTSQIPYKQCVNVEGLIAFMVDEKEYMSLEVTEKVSHGNQNYDTITKKQLEEIIGGLCTKGIPFTDSIQVKGLLVITVDKTKCMQINVAKRLKKFCAKTDSGPNVLSQQGANENQEITFEADTSAACASSSINKNNVNTVFSPNKSMSAQSSGKALKGGTGGGNIHIHASTSSSPAKAIGANTSLAANASSATSELQTSGSACSASYSATQSVTKDESGSVTKAPRARPKSAEQKLEALKEAKRGTRSLTEIANELSVPTTTLISWIKKEDVIKAAHAKDKACAKNVMCGQCGKSFSSRAYWQIHTQKVHGHQIDVKPEPAQEGLTRNAGDSYREVTDTNISYKREQGNDEDRPPTPNKQPRLQIKKEVTDMDIEHQEKFRNGQRELESIVKSIQTRDQQHECEGAISNRCHQQADTPSTQQGNQATNTSTSFSDDPLQVEEIQERGKREQLRKTLLEIYPKSDAKIDRILNTYPNEDNTNQLCTYMLDLPDIDD